MNNRKWVRAISDDYRGSKCGLCIYKDKKKCASMNCYSTNWDGKITYRHYERMDIPIN